MSRKENKKINKKSAGNGTKLLLTFQMPPVIPMMAQFISHFEIQKFPTFLSMFTVDVLHPLSIRMEGSIPNLVNFWTLTIKVGEQSLIEK